MSEMSDLVESVDGRTARRERNRLAAGGDLRCRR